MDERITLLERNFAKHFQDLKVDIKRTMKLHKLSLNPIDFLLVWKNISVWEAVTIETL